MLPLSAKRRRRGVVRRPACGGFPPLARGVARRKAQNPWLRVRCRTRQAPSGAPVSMLSGAGPAFALDIRRDPIVPFGFLISAHSADQERRSSAFGLLDSRVVSQLLAGPRSGPGGSPAPPRESASRKPARRDTAPRPHLTTPHDAPLQKDELGPRITEVWRAGTRNAAKSSKRQKWTLMAC